ncbi:DUF3027 domain-containing protein [Agromyces larvae]|uniref:DUF3027 domain-containing protein n=1 Tax=Agromyces larvae TaxID=2929802 RepID=A0ABY4C313_9MICO|nr:DUF3027 domain-containing protein [Agromyces larvae]UOE45860.1 DUF3027 domain-containing protein [Agromyces larvae]
MPEPEESVATDDAQPAPVADDVLLASAALAQRALLEVTPPETVGSVIGHVVEGEHVLTLLFAADLSGYPGWHWSVTLARVEGAEPTVLETELMPGDRALLAPEWVPWSERLAEYRAAQAAAAVGAAGDDSGSAEGDLDDGDFGDADLDEGSDPADADEGDEFDDDDADDDFGDEDAHEFDGIDIDVLDESDDPFEVGAPVEVHASVEGGEDPDQSEVGAEPEASVD